jgi:hypothetical protein
MTAKATNSAFVILGRIYWVMIGPMLLVILTLTSLANSGGWFTPADFGFLAALGGLPFGRWLEFQGGDPRTSTGEPATRDQLRRYALATTLAGLAVWVVANLIGNYWLDVSPTR